MSTIYKWVTSNGIVSMTWSVFCMWVVGFAVYHTFSNVNEVNSSVVQALGIVFGLPSVAIGVWQWRLGWEAKKECEREHV
tara:strand:- start:42 stop:281 length:240 start_codon:yes stop_codon:yes gene_type:complete